ncbi:hypothetical protein E4U55_004859 [Claviceps digitariae]|nr:hypothetical protein E4U55_004859 [Claviceps digitariae]
MVERDARRQGVESTPKSSAGKFGDVGYGQMDLCSWRKRCSIQLLWWFSADRCEMMTAFLVSRQLHAECCFEW